LTYLFYKPTCVVFIVAFSRVLLKKGFLPTVSISGTVSKKLEDLTPGAVPRELEAFSQQLKQTQIQQKAGKHALTLGGLPHLKGQRH
jgi:hypothetical protein